MDTLPQLIADLEMLGLPPWALPLVGGALGLGLLLVGFSVLGRRRPARPAPGQAQVTYLREDAAQHGMGEERRRSPRRGGNPTAVQVKYRRVEPFEALVVDRSAGGLSLLMDRELEAGLILSIRVVQAPPQVPWVDVKTVHSRPVGERFQIGCQFVAPPPMSVLLFFG
jgi:hypothetical protein